MKKNIKKIIIYSAILCVALAVFILFIFVLQKPDGVIGFLIAISCIYLIIASVLKLCKLSGNFEGNLIAIIELIFNLP